MQVVRQTIVFAATAVLLLTANGAQAASFDCARARSADEIAICHDRELGDLDVQMATLFDVVTGLVAMGERGELRDEQHDWLAQRHQCRADVRCLRHSYRRRIAALRRVLDDIRSRGPY